MFKPGDQVILRDPFWHQGSNLGGKLGIVVSTESHVLVQIKSYEHNPVKCFQYDIDQLDEKGDPVLDDLQILWGDEYDLFRC